MKLRDQVCSIELAEKLKELGVKQESYFWWVWGHNSKMELHDRRIENSNYSAFTSTELGEMLPPFYITRDVGRYNKGKSWWEATKSFALKEELHEQYANTEADARAKMLIYLIEKNLITNGYSTNI